MIKINRTELDKVYNLIEHEQQLKEYFTDAANMWVNMNMYFEESDSKD